MRLVRKKAFFFFTVTNKLVNTSLLMLRPLRAGDFFTGEIPTADLYVLARIIHDWPEEKCLTLLKKIYDMCAPGQYTRYMWGFVVLATNH